MYLQTTTAHISLMCRMSAYELVERLYCTCMYVVHYYCALRAGAGEVLNDWYHKVDHPI